MTLQKTVHIEQGRFVFVLKEEELDEKITFYKSLLKYSTDFEDMYENVLINLDDTIEPIKDMVCPFRRFAITYKDVEPFIKQHIIDEISRCRRDHICFDLNSFRRNHYPKLNTRKMRSIYRSID